MFVLKSMHFWNHPKALTQSEVFCFENIRNSCTSVKSLKTMVIQTLSHQGTDTFQKQYFSIVEIILFQKCQIPMVWDRKKDRFLESDHFPNLMRILARRLPYKYVWTDCPWLG